MGDKGKLADRVAGPHGVGWLILIMPVDEASGDLNAL